ncbi:MAG: hypothetical protein AAF602_09180 [Myxococcota bacterium]
MKQLADLEARLRRDIALRTWRTEPSGGFSQVPLSDDWRVFGDALLQSGDERGRLFDLEERWQRTGERWFAAQRDALLARWRPPESHDGWFAGFRGLVSIPRGDLEQTLATLEEGDSRLVSGLTLDWGSRNGDPDTVVRSLVASTVLGRLQHLDLYGTGALLGAAHLSWILQSGIELVTAKLSLDRDALEVLGHSSARPRCLFLDVGDDPPSDARPLALSRLPVLSSVEELGLQTACGAATLVDLAALPNLRRLRIGQYFGHADGIAALLLGAPNLVELQISAPTLGQDEPVSIPAPCGRLEPLDLVLGERGFGFPTEEGHQSELAASGALGRVRTLEHHGWPSPVPLEELIGTTELEQLEVLRLPHAGLTTSDLDALTKLPRLHRLVLDGNRLGDEGLRWLARWPGISRLTELSLVDVGATVAGVRDLVWSVDLACLERFAVGAVPGDALCRTLAASPTLRPRVLSVLCHDVGIPWTGGLGVLGRSPVLDAIEHLILNGERLDVDTIDVLLDSPKLRRLQVLETRWQWRTASTLEPDTLAALRRTRDAWPALRDIVGLAPAQWGGDQP